MTAPVSTAQPTVDEQPIAGWEAIATAAGRAIQQSVSVNTAKRYAAPGRDNRLPVYKYQNERVYLSPEDLALWARAWLRRRPLGAKVPGAVKGKAA